MASMLVLGVASSVVGVGSGTFATFNAVTSNIGTLATSDIKFVDTANGTGCTGQSSVANGVATGCGALVALSNMIPGDSRLGLITLNNNSTTTPAVTVNWTSDATCAVTCVSSALNTTAASAGGLALMIFRCENAGLSVQQACTGVASTTYVPIVGGCTANPTIAASTGLTASKVSNNASTTIGVGDAAQPTCTGVNIIQAGGALTEFHSITLGAAGNTVTSTNVLLVSDTDNLAAIAYLPSTAANALAGLTSTIEFKFTATQVNGSAQ